MDKRQILALSVAALALGWGAGRMTAKRPEFEEVVQRLDAEQTLLTTLNLRMKAIETGLQTRSSADPVRLSARPQASSDRDVYVSPAQAPNATLVAPPETSQNLTAKAESERLLSSAISAGVWTRTDELEFQRALVRMSAPARFEMMKRQTIAINNQQLSGAPSDRLR